MIREARFPDDDRAVRTLLAEYAGSVGVDLSFQSFDQEVARLPGDYAPPAGGLLLAEGPEGIVGCVGLRRLAPDVAEMKRLFVSASGRGRGIGRELAVAVVELARQAGYRRIRLDTLPTQRAAHQLYRTLGFVEISRYRHNPVPGSRFLELVLD